MARNVAPAHGSLGGPAVVADRGFLHDRRPTTAHATFAAPLGDRLVLGRASADRAGAATHWGVVWLDARGAVQEAPDGARDVSARHGIVSKTEHDTVARREATRLTGYSRPRDVGPGSSGPLIFA